MIWRSILPDSIISVPLPLVLLGSLIWASFDIGEKQAIMAETMIKAEE
jgi:hypothetical protein